MAFVDELKVFIKAGNGGNGVVRWRHEKFIEFGGPAGGDGGKGGDVYVVASHDISLLSKYTHKKDFRAQNGDAGGNKSLHGRGGDELEIPFPVGSVITNLATGKQFELMHAGEKVLILKGGHGGYGNEHFKSATNRSPEDHTDGKVGEEADFFVELKLVVDVGLVGLPNAGKSSLLNTLTNASAKVGAYQFTTLEPNLGAFYGYIIADIPGLIEGASEGKGLGHKFLRHITRTNMLAHLISLENENPMEVYETIRKELETYSDELARKEEIIILTKTDMVDEETAQKTKEVMERLGKPVFMISVINDKEVKEFSDSLIKLLREKEQITAHVS